MEVKSPDEILQTVDTDGTFDQLPFMPEMVEFCGRRFRVSKRVLKTCYYTKLGVAGFRKFRTDDVILLDGVRCSGACHDGCQKACTIFWREAWLRKVDATTVESEPAFADSERLRARLKTSTAPATYFCQASELLKATEPLSRWDRLTGCFGEVRVGNCRVLEMGQRIGRWLFWKIRWKLLGPYGRRKNKSMPMESLNLQADEWVEVKSMKNIKETLNEAACNRGLVFMPDMRVLVRKASSGLSDGSRRLSWMGPARCDSSTIPCSSRDLTADVYTPWAGARGMNFRTGEKFGFAGLIRPI